ncbi:hypothetical protein U9M48_015454 [Paspalum notatum var. saurae]|uniref:Uncharacterized protein n=1 Tax=Paspalum notatum var. saurae TaxID=547442 RepID=A0AAQ3T471_PASNO
MRHEKERIPGGCGTHAPSSAVPSPSSGHDSSGVDPHVLSRRARGIFKQLIGVPLHHAGASHRLPP